jgi:hypothetical protein
MLIPDYGSGIFFFPDPGVKKTPDPGSATLLSAVHTTGLIIKFD